MSSFGERIWVNKAADLTSRIVNTWNDLRTPFSSLEFLGSNPPTFKVFRNDGTAASAALSFNGAASYVNVPDSASLDIASEITISCWIYPTSVATGGDKYLVHKSGAYTLFLSSGNRPAFVIAGTTLTTSVANRIQTANKWYHLAAVYDGVNMTIYVDGVVTATVAKAGAITTNANALLIGASAVATNVFAGKIEELVLFSDGYNTAQVMALYNDGVGTQTGAGAVSLAAGWHFDENAGNTTADFGSGGNTGTLSGATLPTWTTGYIRAGSKGIFAPAFSHLYVNEAMLAQQNGHGYVLGSTLRPHGHWAPADNQLGNVVWKIEVSEANRGETFPVTTTYKAISPASGNPLEHSVISFGDLIKLNRSKSSIAGIRLYRDPDDPDDTYPNDAFMLDFDSHELSDSLGSTTEIPIP